MSKEAWSHGKGDKSRVVDLQNYANNFDNIKFPIKERKNMYNFRTNNPILISDTHDTDVLYTIINTRIPNGSDTVSLGDNGLGFGLKDSAITNTMGYLTRLNNLCRDIDVRLYIIAGNHDATYPHIWNSTWSNIVMTKSGEVGIFPNGKKALFIGGGISVDRYVRKQDFDYWKDEITPHLEHVEKCDVMFSHDTAEHFNHRTATLPIHFQWYVDRDVTLLNDALAQRLNMTDIINRSEVNEIYHGHFHRSIVEEHDGVKCRCLDINELYEYDANR